MTGLSLILLLSYWNQGSLEQSWLVATDAFEPVLISPEYVVTSDHSIYILDGSAFALHRLDKHGQHLNTEIYRDGPGKMRFGSSLSYVRENNTLVVRDHGRRLLLVYDHELKFVKKIRPPFKQFNDDIHYFQMTNSQQAIYLHRFHPQVKRHQGTRVLLQNINKPKPGQLWSFGPDLAPDYQNFQSGNGMSYGRIFIWDQKVMACLSPDGKWLFAGLNSGQDMRVWNVPDATLRAIFSCQLKPYPVTEKDIEQETFTHVMNGKRFTLDDFTIGSVKPPMKTIHADTSGRLWVVLNQVEPDGETGVRIYLRDGRQLGRLSLPPASRIFHVSQTHVWLHQEYDEDINLVKMAYKLPK